MSSPIHHLRRVFLAQPSSGVTDGELLEAFVDRRDGVYFEAIVRRHGPMVLGVCRRVLRDRHDAEDAFQATFLVLVRKAAAVPRDAVGNWLYGVAYRTALNARRAAARRRARERPEDDMPHPTTGPAESWAELRPLLDDELSRLPSKYRSAFVLCDLEKLTRAEAAWHLGVPEGTVSGRLTIARRKLAARLARRGLTLSAGALAATLARGADAATVVPASLVASTVRAGESLAVGAAAGVASTTVVTLADGVAKDLSAASWKPLAAGLIAIPMLAVGTAMLVPRGGEPPIAAAGDPTPTPAERVIPSPPPAELTDREKLQGTWVAVSEEIDGVPSAPPGRAETQFVFADDRVTYRTNRVMREGTYRLDPTQTPGVLDVILGKDAVMNFIYEVTDTRLRLCWTKGGPRPREFDTNKGPFGTILFVFEKR